MARYVLVEFQDDATAAAFCEKITQSTKQGKKFRLAGIFAKPKVFCTCTPSFGYHKNQIAMGSKYGWWVCLVCKRPRLGGHQPINLLPFTEDRLDEAQYTTLSTCIQLKPVSIDVTPILTSRLQNRIEAERLAASQ